MAENEKTAAAPGATAENQNTTAALAVIAEKEKITATPALAKPAEKKLILPGKGGVGSSPPFSIYTTGPVQIGSAVLPGIRNVASNLGSTVRGEPSSGQIYSPIVALYGQKPTAGFQTEAIEEAMSSVGPLGLALSAGSPLVLFGSKWLAGGGIDSAGDHLSISCPLGIVFPRTLTAAHQGDAVLDYEALFYSSDGAADPFTIITTATLPTIPHPWSKWALDYVEIGSQQIYQEVRVSVDFGIRCQGEGADSQVRDQIVSITAVEPRITIASSNQGAILALLGVSGGFTLVLRNRVSGGAFGSSTLTFTATEGLAMQEQPFSASGHRPGELTVQGHVQWDGTNAPVTFTPSGGAY
jgi:hypothetical protein